MLCFFFSNAQTPIYYQGIDFTLSGDSLKEQLANLIIYTGEKFNPVKKNDNFTNSLKIKYYFDCSSSLKINFTR